MAALYQRARPVTFAELVGQEHVRDVLEAAVRDDRTSHAYLFSGPRGVGKTTTARLLAMAVNCEAAPEGADRPCGECESCLLVRSGAHPDVTELDAASNNSVDDVRDLQAHIGLSSMRGGKRVWILDEAHMLSKAAANALLKTLEEPPPGLIFILATTEPEKLPPTILSRCQHFRFRRLADAEIRSKLERLCSDAGVSAESEALALIARSADGGMRDAESLLDRLLVKGETLTLAAAEQALGLPAQQRLGQMGAALLGGDLGPLLAEAGSLYRDGYAPRTIAEQLARSVRDELHLVLAGKGGWGGADREPLLMLLHALDDESERFVRQNDLYALEVTLIKSLNALAAQAADRRPAPSAGRRASLTSKPAATATAAAQAAAADTPPTTPAQPSASRQRQAPADREAPPEAPKARAAPAGDAPAPRTERAERDETATATFSWHAVRTAASPQLKAFMAPARVEVDGLDVTVHYDDKHAFHRTQLINKLDEFKAHVASVAGPDYRVTVAGASSSKGSAKGKGRGQAPASGRQSGAPASEPAARGEVRVEEATERAAEDASESIAAAALPEEPSPQAEDASSETPAPPQPEALDPSDYAPTELELAGFDEDHGAWMDDPHSGLADAFEEGVAPGSPAGQGSLEEQAASLLASSGADLAEVRQLFPGRVTQVLTTETAAPRAGGETVLEGDPEIEVDDGAGSYDDESQDRLSFGP